MSYVTYAALILLGISQTKILEIRLTNNKVININTIFSLLFIAFFVYLAYTKQGADDAIYELSYHGLVDKTTLAGSTGSGILYDQINIFFGQILGLNFRIFKATIIAFVFLVYFWFASKHTRHPEYVLALIALYPALLLITQFRFALATAFLVIAIECYIRKRYLSMALFLVIGGSIHTSILFLAVVVALFPLYKRLKKSTIVVILLAALIGTIFYSQIIKLLYLFVDEHRMSVYLINRQTGVLGLILYISSFYINYKIAEAMLQDPKIYEIRLARITYLLKILCFLTIPMLIRTPDMMRVSRATYIFEYVLVARYIDIKERYIYIPLFKSNVKLPIRAFTTIYAMLTFAIVAYMNPQVMSQMLG